MLRRAGLGLFVGALLFAPAVATAGPALVFEPVNGTVFYSEDPDAQWFPASLTKLMTAYVTFQALKRGEVQPDTKLTCTKNAVDQAPSKLWLPVGGQITVDIALKVLIVKSANDVAVMLAEGVGGSEEAFVVRMNEAAQKLGMTRTHYANPNGLPDDRQVTSARDLAKLTRAIIVEFPEYADIFALPSVTVGKKVLRTHNRLLASFPGADGMKTGFICESGFNFIGSATRQGRTLSAIVLGADSITDRAAETAALLAQGFANAEAAGPTLASMPVDGNGVGEATNMRQALCSKEARQKKKQKLADAGGEDDTDQAPLVMGSPYLHKLDHPRNVVMVSLGGATGPGGLPEPVEYADVPIPTPRPDYTPPAKPAKPVAKAQSATVQ